MSVNDFVTNSELKKQIFLEKAWKETLPDAFFSKFMPDFPPFQSEHIEKTSRSTVMDSAQNMPIVVKRDLAGQQGDQLSFSLVKALEGKGIKGSTGATLKDNAERLKAFKHSVTLEEYAHSTWDNNPLGRKGVMFVITEAMKSQIMAWAVEKFDENAFDAIEEAPSTIVLPDGIASSAALEVDDTVNMDIFRKARAIAKTRSLGSRFRIPPIKIGGKDYYVAVGPEDVLKDLKDDSEFKDAQQRAEKRGSENPIFAGADFVTIDGIIFYSNERAGMFEAGASGTVPGARISLFGQRALCYAAGLAPQIVMEYEDFERKIGYAVKFMHRFSKPNFDGKDYGSLQIQVAHTDSTGRFAELTA